MKVPQVRRSLIRAACVVALGAVLVSTPSRAATSSTPTLDGLLDRGFRVLVSSSVPGAFQGCTKDLTIAFDDDSAFTCLTTHAASGFHVRAVILRRIDDGAYIALIGGHAYAGSVGRLRGRDLPRALTVSLPDDVGDITPSTPTGFPPIKPIEGSVAVDPPPSAMIQPLDADFTEQSRGTLGRGPRLGRPASRCVSGERTAEATPGLVPRPGYCD